MLKSKALNYSKTTSFLEVETLRGVPTPASGNKTEIPAAVELASRADMVVLFIGYDLTLEREVGFPKT